MAGLNKYKAYPEYKDSGVEWLGEIPECWSVCRLKNLATIKNGQDYKLVQADHGYPVMGSGGKFTFASKFMYDKPSVLLGRKGTIDKPLYINEPFWTVDTMYYTELNENVDAKYFYYLALTIQFLRYSTNTALPSMTQENLSNYYFSTPTIKFERNKIAEFLDHETVKIDNMIEKQQQLIELLKEKRQAVISHAVTKGLNPDVLMKDSGVEWLGEVPEHWVAVRVKQISSFITSGPRGWSDFITDEGNDIFLQSGDLNNELGLQLDKAKRVSPPKNAEGMRTKLVAGDVVVCITGANTGRVAIVPELSQSTYINQHLSLIRPNTSIINSAFLGYSLASSVGRSFFDVAQYGLKEGLSLGNVSEAPLALPPKHEQDVIVKHLESIRNNYDNLSRLSTIQIELLKERRTALISAAVTGKIDVRDWVAPDSSEMASIEESPEVSA
ncbi:restriction endonuclease subunit S [Pectobacterium punjabense]|uniref:restriction endonuclease subunit S n=1 Tax=Pectobacterium punjabense TaxID=2108399 RepID=UPI0032ED1B1E